MKNGLIFCIILILAFLVVIPNGFAQPANPAHINASGNASDKFPPIPINPLIYFGLFALIFIVVMGILGYNVILMYNFEKKKMDSFCKNLEKPTKEEAELFKLDLEGMKGLFRSLMAMAIIFIVGLVLLYGVFEIGMDKASVSNLASLLAGAVTTIIGFYFGTRAAEGAAEGKTAPPAKPEPTTKEPKIHEVSPKSGKVNTVVTISGESFGDSQKESQLLLNDDAIRPTLWKDNEIVFSIPAEQKPVQTKIYVIVSGKRLEAGFNVTP